MTYDDLMEEASMNGIHIKEIPLLGADGRNKNNKIAIRKDISSTAKKKCVLAEEICHCYYTVGDIKDQLNVANRKQEYKVRMAAAEKMLGLNGIIEASEVGCSSLFAMAEYLEIDMEFLIEYLEYYKNKYGIYTEYGEYVICFEPVLYVYKKI